MWQQTDAIVRSATWKIAFWFDVRREEVQVVKGSDLLKTLDEWKFGPLMLFNREQGRNRLDFAKMHGSTKKLNSQSR